CYLPQDARAKELLPRPPRQLINSGKDKTVGPCATARTMVPAVVTPPDRVSLHYRVHVVAFKGETLCKVALYIDQSAVKVSGSGSFSVHADAPKLREGTQYLRIYTRQGTCRQRRAHLRPHLVDLLRLNGYISCQGPDAGRFHQGSSKPFLNAKIELLVI